jgi:hypothetical protein
MAIADWFAGSSTQLEALERTGPEPDTTPSLMERVRLFLLRRRINAMLRRAVAPVRYENAGALPPHLMRDIGLPPPM